MSDSSASRVRQVLSGVGRVLTGAGVLALAGGLVAAATLRPPAESPGLEPAQIDVGAAPVTLVCPPVPLLPTGDGGDLDYDEQFETGGESELADVGVVLGRDGQEPATASAGELGSAGSEIPAAGSVRLVESESPEPLLLQAQPSEQAALAAGLSLARTGAGDLRGLTAASCTSPASSAWLVGGQTEPGSSSRLTLTNPGQTPVTVTVRGWGSVGAVEPFTSAIAPGDVTSVLLEALTLESRLGLHIAAEGGRVTASLQETVLDGLVSQGSAVIGPAADPATELYVGPFPVVDESGTAMLRLVNPGQETAEVTIEVLGEGASTLPGAEALVVEAGTASDIALDGIDAGAASVRVTSDQPVTGAVRIKREGAPSELDPDRTLSDRAWLPAAEPSEHGLFALPADDALVDEAALALTNPGEQDRTVTVRTVDPEGARGEPVEVRIPALSTSSPEDLGLAGAVAVEISGAPVLASLTLSAGTEEGTLIGLVPITPDAHSDQSVAVHVGAS
ncbi:DUF5719 family protein [Ruania suaedae]|uniref:DUF5719 family protein n=1 Tax=Ruania suaedae TaxID=2897774 RepID=UPI001E306558|nr:DUF5719 family protein [Ruania suaedae]UFU02220.1 DUF5719 family protein [Ruania suaedae]